MIIIYIGVKLENEKNCVYCKSIKSAERLIRKNEATRAKLHHKACKAFQNGDKQRYYALMEIVDDMEIEAIYVLAGLNGIKKFTEYKEDNYTIYFVYVEG